MRDKIAETVKETLRYTVDSFAGVLSFDTDPNLSEEENVEKIIRQTGVVCTVIACVNPIPLTEFVVLTPIHAKMTFHIGKAKGFAITQERALEVLREVASSISLSLGAGVLASFVKLVPVLGQIVYAPIVFGTTYGIGRVIEAYFDGLRKGEIPTAAELKDLFSRELSKGKAHGASLRKEQIEKVYQDLKKKIDEREGGRPAAREREEEPERPRKDAKDPAVTPSRITIREKPSRKPSEKTIGGSDEPGDVLPERAPETVEPARGKSIGPEDPPPAQPVAAPTPMPAPAPPVVAAAAPPPAKVNLVDELERLAKLRDLGALTPEEFDAAKKKLLQG
jgi:uncharacterized protein (DUF697 family)